RIPLEVLTKPGRFSDTERALMNRHPAEGARIILRAEEDLDLAAVVAYEHHIMLNGDGYPTFQFRRDCHEGSKLIHVCDVYDALRTHRPYREAWPQSKTLSYIEDRAGTEFDPELAGAFVRMMRQWEPQVAVMTDERTPVPGAPEGTGASPATCGAPSSFPLPRYVSLYHGAATLPPPRPPARDRSRALRPDRTCRRGSARPSRREM